MSVTYNDLCQYKLRVAFFSGLTCKLLSKSVPYTPGKARLVKDTTLQSLEEEL